MHEREYKRLRATIEADYRKKLDALTLIYSMSNGSAVPAAGSNRTTLIKGALAQAVVGAISQTSGDFNVRDIEESLKIDHPELKVIRASLSNTLKRLEGKEVELVEKGMGKRPSKYRRRARVG